MEFLQQLAALLNWESISQAVLRVGMILLFAWVAIKLLKRLLIRLENNLLAKSQTEGEPPSESGKRIETLIRLVRQASLLALWLTAGLMVLNEFGVEIGPVIASAGIIGLAIGFGAQNLVRDVISGFFLILENQVRVGDVAIINGTGGLVEKVNFRTTVLRDLAGVVHIFPNGTITTLSNMTKEWSAYIFEIGIAYKEDTDKVMAAIREVCKGMCDDTDFGPLIVEEPELFGVDKFADSAVIIKGRIKTRPIRQWEVGREFLRRIKHTFDAQRIEIPFPHRTLYFGEASKPIDLQLMEKYRQESTTGD